MAISVNNSNIGSMYYGSTKIANAYIGSNLVYSAGGGGLRYDVFQLVITSATSQSDNITIGSLEASAATLDDGFYSPGEGQGWFGLSQSALNSAVSTTSNLSQYAYALKFNFTATSDSTSFVFKTGQYYAPSMSLIAYKYGIKNGVSTLLNSRSYTQSTNLTIYV